MRIMMDDIRMVGSLLMVTASDMGILTNDMRSLTMVSGISMTDTGMYGFMVTDTGSLVMGISADNMGSSVVRSLDMMSSLAMMRSLDMMSSLAMMRSLDMMSSLAMMRSLDMMNI